MSSLREGILQRLFEVQSLSKSSDHNLEEIRTRNADAILDAVIAFVGMWDDEEYISNDELKAELEAAKSKQS